ncbi:MAG: 6-phosphofructokinase [Anaerolineales bacterium]
MPHFAILTGGGDAPGLNAVVRAAVKTAENDYAATVTGIRNGFEGLLDADGLIPLSSSAVADIQAKGGTILGAANRGNPFARRVIKDGVETIEDRSSMVVERIKDHKFDAVIVVGGDGTLSIARELFHMGVPVIGVPKTIDNDVGGTQASFGFDTALNVAVEAIDRLRTTAESHQRAMVLEVMGRNAGFIALHAGLSGGADVILIPEIPFQRKKIIARIEKRKELGDRDSLIVVSEGARPAGGEQVISIPGDQLRVPRLGGVSNQVADFIQEDCGLETRVTILGHIQRGGTPTAFDRWLATRFGAAAVRLAAAGGFGRMLAYQGDAIIDLDLAEALAQPKRVDLGGDAVQTARNLGISLGD